ncbi:MAG: hypothetical protein DMF34_03135 [Verrucomicrobia bacterium]|nr:MAG: hypothetical protein DMF34_03135 [Verrucomicrobiota bacterium]
MTGGCLRTEGKRKEDEHSPFQTRHCVWSLLAWSEIQHSITATHENNRRHESDEDAQEKHRGE